jgi:hypothetical protein
LVTKNYESDDLADKRIKIIALEKLEEIVKKGFLKVKDEILRYEKF